jgi:hypothetical protein
LWGLVWVVLPFSVPPDGSGSAEGTEATNEETAEGAMQLYMNQKKFHSF